ncbi:hypothetical protein BH23PSE1_BH23PSE1_09280 [soil metagenome]
MRRFFLWGAGAVVLLAAVSIGWIALAPTDPAGWHVDPVAAPDDGAANAWRLGPAGEPGSEAVAGWDAAAPVYDLDVGALAEAVDRGALGEPGTQRIAGGPQGLWVTYLQRSRWMRFPDDMPVRAMPIGGCCATLAIYSRARFGQSDRGVNRARVERWLAALGDVETGR